MRRKILIVAGVVALACVSSGTQGQDFAPLRQVAMAGPQLPPAARFPQDPADSLYRAARAALSGGDHARAAELFRDITRRFPRSAYASDALYWEAFALYRVGGSANLRAALGRLELQRSRFPDAATGGDGNALSARIQGALAQGGDARAAAGVMAAARPPAAPPAPGAPSQLPPRPPGAPPTPPAPGRSPQASAQCPADQDDVRLMALNALMQMSSEQAVPLLRGVLARRDACSAPLREKAVFLLSQRPGVETENLLLSTIRDDPDPKVKEQAVFWLSQIPSERTLGILQQILRSGDDSLREKALFALSQHPGDEATAVLRGLAEQSSASTELRGQAIFWLAQKPSAETAAYLHSLYARLDSPALKENALFALSQMPGETGGRWLMEVALDESEPLEARKQALFWAGQTGTSVEELSSLYDRLTEREMRAQVVFVLSQRQERAALDRLLSIARSEPDAELRRQAIFWLGHSQDPRAAEFLMSLIDQR